MIYFPKLVISGDFLQAFLHTRQLSRITPYVAYTSVR